MKTTQTDKTTLANLVLQEIYKNHFITGDIRVEILGHKAILKGTVESSEQKNFVVDTVLHVKGIRKVENQLCIDWMC